MDSVECTALLDITYQITYGLNQQSPCKRTVPEEMDKRSINRRFKQDHDTAITYKLGRRNKVSTAQPLKLWAKNLVRYIKNYWSVCC